MSRSRKTTQELAVVGSWLAFFALASCWVAAGFELFVDTTLRFTREPEDVIAAKHSQVVLDCSANSSNGSDVEISWRRNGELLIPDSMYLVYTNGSLVIRYFGRQQGDEGLYECIARSGSSALASRAANLQEAVLGSFSGQPSSITVPVGGNARFECTIAGVPKPNITWRINGRPLPLSLRFVDLTSDVLQLVNVTASDVGSYSCHASSFGHEKTSQRAELTLGSGADSIHILSQPKDQEVELGSTATFECLPNHSGYSVIWSRKDGVPLPVDRARTLRSGSLEIRGVQKTDAVNYSCEIENLPTVRAETKLSVTVPPRFLSSSKLGDETRAQTIRIICEFSGLPTPTVTWMKNGQSIGGYGRIKIQGNALMISQSMDTDSALYQCWAENSVGKAGTVIPLNIKSSGKDPRPPTGLRSRCIDSKSIELTWDVAPPTELEFVGYSVHSWPLLGGGENQKVTIQPPIVITNLQPYTNYTFFVRAYNKWGASEPSQYIVQATEEDVPLVAPEVQVFPSRATSLQVMWEELPFYQARGTIVQHKIFYKDQDDLTHEITVDGAVYKYEITDLETDERYSVRVLSATGAGFPKLEDDRWPWVSQIVSESTHVGVKEIPNLKIRLLNATTVQMTWDTPESLGIELLGFKIQYNLIGEEPKTIIKMDYDLEHTLCGLKPDSVYEISIGAFTDLGDELYKQTVRTPPLGIPSPQPPLLAPMISDARPVNETAIHVSWLMPGMEVGSILYYSVWYFPTSAANSDKNPQEMFVNSTGTHMIIGELKSLTVYQFAVRGHTAHGPGPLSAAVTCSTEEGRPPALLHVTWFLQEPTVVQLNWKIPPHTSVVVYKYVVSYCEDKYAYEDTWNTHIENGSLCYTVIHGLKSRTVYQVTIRAENRKGAGPASSLKVSTGIGTDGEGSSNDRLMGIVIGIGISGCCLIVCVIIILLRNRCFPPPRGSSLVMQEHANGFAAPLRCNGYTHGRSDSKHDCNEPDGTTPMLTQTQDHETTDSKLKMPWPNRVDIWSSVDDGRTGSTDKSTTVV